IKSHASSCLKKVTIEAMQDVFANSGYYRNAPLKMGYGDSNVAYYVYEGKEKVPTLNAVASNIAKYIDDNINPCISSYSADLVVGIPKSEVSLGKTVNAEVSQTLAQTQDDITATVKSYDAEVDSDARKVYADMAELYTEVKNISSFDLVAPGVLALKQRYELYMPELADPNTFLYVMMFNNSIEGELDIEYNFALKFRPKAEPPMTDAMLLGLFTGGDPVDGGGEEEAGPEVEVNGPPIIDDTELEKLEAEDNATSRDLLSKFRDIAVYLNKMDELYKPQDINFTEAENEE
ncbi:MAG: hypothetical protein V1906_03420, partial [Candidatus Woesearchaeota archaeon]